MTTTTASRTEGVKIGRYEVRYGTDAETDPARPWELWDASEHDFIEAFTARSAAVKEAKGRLAESLAEKLSERIACIRSLEKLEAIAAFLKTI